MKFDCDPNLEAQLMKEFESLTISNDFIFGATMESRPDLCKRLIEIILGIKVRSIEYVEREKSIEERTDAKGIRLDVYVEEAGTNRSFDLEMQVANKYDLEKRLRYYQGLLDMDKLKPGEKYTRLGESYIIFICTFDYFKRGLRKYTFREKCIEDGTLELGDGATKVVLNASGLRGTRDIALNNFLDYVMKREVKDDEFVEELDAAVEEVIAGKRWRLRYVKLEMLRREWQEEAHEQGRAEGHAEGRAEGRVEGRAEGEGKLAALIKRLISEGKTDAIEKITDDRKFRRELYELYGIN